MRRKLTDIDLAYNARMARNRRHIQARKNTRLLRLWKGYREGTLFSWTNIQPLINVGLLKYDRFGVLREWDKMDQDFEAFIGERADQYLARIGRQMPYLQRVVNDMNQSNAITSDARGNIAGYGGVSSFNSFASIFGFGH